MIYSVRNARSLYVETFEKKKEEVALKAANAEKRKCREKIEELERKNILLCQKRVCRWSK